MPGQGRPPLGRALPAELFRSLEATVPAGLEKSAGRLAVTRPEIATASDSVLAARLGPVLHRLETGVAHPERIGEYPQAGVAHQYLSDLLNCLS